MLNGETEDFFPSTSQHRYPKKIIVHPTNDNIIFVLTNSFVLKTTDGGENWTIVCNKVNVFPSLYNNNDTGFEDIIFDPLSQTTMYVSGQIMLKSIDGGNNWIDITTSVTGDPNVAEVTTCKMDAKVFNDNSKIWYFYTYPVVVSPDKTESWSKVIKYETTSNQYSQIYDKKQLTSLGAGWNKINVCVHPDNENEIYISGLQIIKLDAEDALNVTYEVITSKIFGRLNHLHDDVRDMCFFETNAGEKKLIVGCDGGVTIANKNSAGNWVTNDISYKGSNPLTELNISEVYAISTSGNSGKIAFNCQDIGGYTYCDGELCRFLCGDGGVMMYDNIYDNYLHAADIQDGFYIYDLNKKESIELDMPQIKDSYFFPPVLKNPENPKEIYYGVKGLYKYDDIYAVINGTASNEATQVKYFDGNAYQSFFKPTDIEISHNNNQIRYISTEYAPNWGTPIEKSFYKSTDGGNTWLDMSEYVITNGGPYISDIELDPFSDDQLWLTYCRGIESPKIKRLYFDQGTNDWICENYNTGLENYSGLPVHEMVIDPISGEKYIATDVGVFKYNDDPQVKEWENIGDGKQRMITDIEINNYQRRLYVSTFGGGIWYTELDDCPDFNETDYIVNNDETWTIPKIMNRNVVVKPGATLTIKDVVYFHENAKLIVERAENTVTQGGILKIDGGKLTNSCDGVSWKGVEVHGYSNIDQNTIVQGYVYISNKGTIENAKIGINANMVSSSETRGYTGGVVRSDGGVFINNITGVKLTDYQGNIRCDFYNTDFITNDDWQHEGTGPQSFIELNNFYGGRLPNISGCNFINMAVNNEIVTGKGKGIESFNSAFIVNNECGTTGYPSNFMKECLFKNLNYAIYATGASPTALPTKINAANFINNIYGIYIGAINNIEITSNYFSLNVSTDSYGLYLDECTDYHVEDNLFECDQEFSLETDRFGIIVNYSGQYINEIYRNNFNHINTGINVQDENRNSDKEGLHIRCNLFTDTKYDIKVLPTNNPQGLYLGIAKSQGMKDTIPQPEDMAGNNFYYNYTTDYDDLDNESPCFGFDYYYPNEADVPHLEPIDNTTSVKAIIVNYLDSWKFDQGCPSKLDNGGGSAIKSELLITEQSIDSIDNILNVLVDEGNTEALVIDVESSVPAETMSIYNQLLDASPYLSDSVVSTSIDKEDVLPNAMVRDIMVANTHTAKSGELMEKLDERINPMPGYMKAEILLAKDSLSPKEKIEASLSCYKLKKHNIYNNLIKLYKFDTINQSASSDSLIDLYINDNSLLSNYQLAYTRLNRKEFTEGKNVLISIPDNFALTNNEYSEYQSMVDYYNLLLATDTSIIYYDSSIQQQYRDIYTYGNGKAVVYARNFLIKYDSLIYKEPIAHSNVNKEGDVNEYIYQQLMSDRPQFLKIMPNPAKDYIIIEYQQEMEGNAEINIADINGNNVRKIYIKNITGQEVINTKTWKPGIYISTLNSKGKLIESIKFSIIN